MNRFSNKRNNRHGEKHKRMHLIVLEHDCKCSRILNEKDKTKENMKKCLYQILNKKLNV